MTATSIPTQRRLWFRFLAAAGVVAAVGLAVGYVVADRVAHEVFDVALLAGLDPAEEHRRFESAIDWSLVIAFLFTVVVVLCIAVLVRWRVTQPIDRIRRGLGRLAEGRYDHRIPSPVEPELAMVAADVNHLAEVLDRSEERRRALVADLTHELRGPLATVGGYIEAMQDGIVECTPELLAELAGECRRLDRLTADLWLVSRLDEGALPLDLCDVDLAEACRRAVGRLQNRFAAGAVQVTVDALQPAIVHADPDRLDQILTNVLGNAAKYTPPGGRVRVVVTADGRVGRCTVTDTGCGIPPEDLPHVFDRFFRGNGANRVDGTGIGLTVARGLARVQGGDVFAASPGAGAGATFTLELPAASVHRAFTPPDRGASCVGR